MTSPRPAMGRRVRCRVTVVMSGLSAHRRRPRVPVCACVCLPRHWQLTHTAAREPRQPWDPINRIFTQSRGRDETAHLRTRLRVSGNACCNTTGMPAVWPGLCVKDDKGRPAFAAASKRNSPFFPTAQRLISSPLGPCPGRRWRSRHVS